MAGLTPAKDPRKRKDLLTLVGFRRRPEAEKARQASEAQTLRRESRLSLIATGNTSS